MIVRRLYVSNRCLYSTHSFSLASEDSITEKVKYVMSFILFRCQLDYSRRKWTFIKQTARIQSLALVEIFIRKELNRRTEINHCNKHEQAILKYLETSYHDAGKNQLHCKAIHSTCVIGNKNL